MTDRRSASHAGEPTLPNEERDEETNRQFEHELAAAHAAQLAGDVSGARDLIERALRYKPRDQRARNLLGLTLFKLGELARAEAIYRGLIEDHPADPTLRVNLGLVFLKHGASTDAARCFTTALDLQPEHSKAQNYLGLALAQKGEHLQARDWFILAGNTAMAERMDGLLASAGYREPPPMASVPIGRAHVAHAPGPPAAIAPVVASAAPVAPAASALSTSEVFGAAPAPPESQPIDRGPVESRHDSGSTSEFSRPLLPQGWGSQPGVQKAAAEAAAIGSPAPASGSASPISEKAASSSAVATDPAVEDAALLQARREREAAKTDPTLAPVSFADPAAANREGAAAPATAAPALAPPAAAAAEASAATESVAPKTNPAPAPAIAVAPPANAAPAPSPAPAGAPAAVEADTARLSAYTRDRRLAVPTSEGSFAIGPAEVVVFVRGEMLTRLDGLVASWGTATIRSELKRFRGKATDKTFGEGSRRMLRASGEGRYVISREGRAFTALELGDEPAYFREEVLFAFEESLTFENGRVPSKLGSDLHLVHLRGRGRLLLVSGGIPRAVEVRKGEPLRIPMDQLIGWHGPLIQPRVVPIVEEAPEFGVALELSGEGRALVDAPHA